MSVSNNSVEVSGGTIDDIIYGGYVEVDRDGAVTVTGNSVNVSGGNISNNIHGGYGDGGDVLIVSNNNVAISNITIRVDTSRGPGHFHGGTAVGSVDGNGDVAVTDNSIVLKDVVILNDDNTSGVYGGRGFGSGSGGDLTVSNNSIGILGLTIGGSIFGGTGTKTGDGAVTITGNSVNVSDGTISGNVYGAPASAFTTAL